MNVTELTRHLPGEIIPVGLMDATRGRESNRKLRRLLLEQNRAEGHVFCGRMISVYCLWQHLYGLDEAELVTMPEDGIARSEMIARRRELSARLTDAEAVIATTLHIGPAAASATVDQAIGFVERLPKILALVDTGELAVPHARELLSRSRVLDAAAARRFDDIMSGIIADGKLGSYALPVLRERADRVAIAIDPEAAERRRRNAIEDRCVRFKPADAGMATAYALLTAHEAIELNTRIDDIADTVCPVDPRTREQRRADGLIALVHGRATLGCRCETAACPWLDAVPAAPGDDCDPTGGAVARYRVLVHVIAADSTLDGGDEREAYLIGHGPITAQHARDIASRRDAVRRRFGVPVDGEVDERELVPAAPHRHGVTDPDRAPAPVPEPGDASAPHNRRRPVDLIPNWQPSTQGPAPAPPEGTHPAAAVAEEGPEQMKPEVEDVTPDQRERDDTDRAETDEVRTNKLETRDRTCDDSSTTEKTEDEKTEDEQATPEQGAPEQEGDGRPAEPIVGPADRVRADGTVEHSEPGPERPTGPPRRQARGSRNHRLSTDQRLYLLMLLPYCVFPTCTRPAARCEYDHSQEYDHADPEHGGPTCICNLQPLCKAHHDVKTAGLWLDTRLPDGRILWTSTLHHYDTVVDPLGAAADLFPELGTIRWIFEPIDPAHHRLPKRPTRTKTQQEHDRRKRLRNRNRRRLAEARQRKKITTGSLLDDRLLALLTAAAEHAAQETGAARHRFVHGPLPVRDHPQPIEDTPPF